MGASVIALALNTEGLSKEEVLKNQTRYKKSLGIPVVLPLEEGVKDIISEIKGLHV